jgi:hypothetical protein
MHFIRVHDHELHEVLCKILVSLERLELIMATTAAEFTAGFARIDAATTAIAERLRTLSAGLGGMTPAEEDAAKAQLDALAATLEAMGANPDQPVPVPVPPEPPPVTP